MMQLRNGFIRMKESELGRKVKITDHCTGAELKILTVEQF